MTYFQAELNEAREAIQRVKNLHPKVTSGFHKDGKEWKYEAGLCTYCSCAYPCDTIEALEGTL
jgi:hypothetical protein